ncbi:hypothetical protein ACIPRI_13345 [Variovorax sp. LARHSF232]
MNFSHQQHFVPLSGRGKGLNGSWVVPKHSMKQKKRPVLGRFLMGVPSEWRRYAQTTDRIEIDAA